jgi:hypothetical protein
VEVGDYTCYGWFFESENNLDVATGKKKAYMQWRWVLFSTPSAYR